MVSQSSAFNEGRPSRVPRLQRDVKLLERGVETVLIAREVRSDGVVQEQQMFMHHLHLETETHGFNATVNRLKRCVLARVGACWIQKVGIRTLNEDCVKKTMPCWDMWHKFRGP